MSSDDSGHSGNSSSPASQRLSLFKQALKKFECHTDPESFESVFIQLVPPREARLVPGIPKTRSRRGRRRKAPST